MTDGAGHYPLCRLPLPDPGYGRTCAYAFKDRRWNSLGFEFRRDTVLNIELPAERSQALRH